MAGSGGQEHGEGHATAWFEAFMHDQHAQFTQFIQNDGLFGVYKGASLDVASYGANAAFSSWVVCIVLIVLALIARMGLNSIMTKEGMSKYEGDSGFGVRNLFEIYIEGMYNLTVDSLGKKDAKVFFWLIGGLFIYILFNNFVGMLPLGAPATKSVSNNFAMALIVLFVFVGAGIIRNGMGFFKHMAGPIWWLAPLIFLIEALGVFIIRPVTLSVRLAANMTGDHEVMGIAYQTYEFLLPTFTFFLGTFVSFIQSFVFTLLTIVYIALSVEHDDDHH